MYSCDIKGAALRNVFELVVTHDPEVSLLYLAVLLF